jgi:hypothetical protein
MSVLLGFPSTTFTSIKDLFSDVENSEDDVLFFTSISPATMEEIFSARDESFREFGVSLYSAKSRMLVIKTPPSRPHEAAHRQMDFSIWSQIGGMGLRWHWVPEGGATYRKMSNNTCMLLTAGEGDSASRPRLTRPSKGSWPTLVIECGYSQTMAALREKAYWWFEESNYQVKIVLLISLHGANESMIIEKWKTPDPPARDGATLTRIAARQQPENVKTITIGRNPNISNTHPDWLSNNRYSVFSGPLRLEFKDLFLREPAAGTMEGDIVIEDRELQLIAFMTWQPVE